MSKGHKYIDGERRLRGGGLGAWTAERAVFSDRGASDGDDKQFRRNPGRRVIQRGGKGTQDVWGGTFPRQPVQRP